eukprot:1728584-Prorocentrum_lima.AAC.1
MYNGGTAHCVYGTMTTDPFPVLGGIRQGCPLSVLIWNLVMSTIVSSLVMEWGERGCGWKFGLEEIWLEGCT